MERVVDFRIGVFESGIVACGDFCTGRYNDERRAAFVSCRDDLGW